MSSFRGPWFVIQHVEYEGPGTVAEEAASRGLRIEVRRMDLGESLPEPDDVGGLVVMGGPMGVYEADRIPHLAAEMDLIRGAVRAGRPVLGICLGSQLLAGALGARVYKGPAPEIGFGAVTLTPAGESDPVMGPDGPTLSVLHWHYDTFDLPQGAVRLAGSDLYPNQAFSAGEGAYGFQFHVEMDAAMGAAWGPHLPAGLVLDEPRRREAERTGRRLFERFFDLVID